MKPLKVKLISQSSSTGRGVGFYHQFLQQSLAQLSEVELVTTKPDLVHYTFFDLFYPTLPLFNSCPTVVTVHDLTPLVLDRLYPKGLKGYLGLLHQRLSLAKVSAIITDSHNSKKDLVRYFNLSEKIIHVTPLAVDPIFRKSVSRLKLKSIIKKYHLPHEFVLTVAGGPNPNKNLPALAQATAEIHIPLVIVGGGLTQKLATRVHPELKDLQTLRTYKHVITPGFVPTTDLLALYKLAEVYCQPSLYEGFGLPLLEAMTAGCLVVSSDTSSLPEIYSPKTITFNPHREDDLVEALEKALNLKVQPRQTYIRAAQHKAADFDWSITAKLTAQVYEQVLRR